MPANQTPYPLLAARRRAFEEAWAGRRGTALIASGVLIPIEGSDQFHDFHAHPEHYYLSGSARPGDLITYHPDHGWTFYFIPDSEDDRVWIGDSPGLERLKEMTGADQVEPSANLARALEARRGEPVALLGNHDFARNPAAYGVPNWASLEVTIDDEWSEELSTHISEARRAKDPAELATMRAAAAASIEGHLLGMRTARPGMTERDLQVEIEAEFFRHGGDRTAYGSIVGTGSNGAVLHFAPTRRTLRDGDIVLIDAGAEIDGYASDVTRTYPAGRTFTGIQRDLYSLVLSVQEEAIAKARPGVEYRDLHLGAALGIASGLRDLGILKGDPHDLVDRDVHALFFPHGLGHMLGLATHDSGGCLAGRTPSDRFGLKWLRADLPLQPGYVVTIEPGIYFISAVLNDPARRAAFADAIAWERVDTLIDFGGIRIEDDIHITESGAEVLSAALPKSIDAIEALRAEAPA